MTEPEPPSATQNIPKNPPEERELSEIKVEVETEKEVKKRARKLKLKSRSVVFKKIDKLIKQFSLDKKLDKKETDDYFLELENKIYQNMKKSLYKQKEYVQHYSDVVQEYQRLSQKYSVN